jgi:1-pyrroline-4-hydroxy-2-carboxylate deaminase
MDGPRHPALAGVHVALTTPFDPTSGDVDVDAYRSHCDQMLADGVRGLVPNGSLSEFDTLSPDERRASAVSAAEAAAGRGSLIVGVSGPSWRIAAEYAEHAATIGADAVLLLPPINHAPTRLELRDHFRSVAAVGLPVIVDNDPIAARTDLTPALMADLGQLDGIVAIKESSGDVRRIGELQERVPHLDVLCGADDLALESAVMGAAGWIGGFTGAFTRETIRLFDRAAARDLAIALPLYRALLPLLRWNSTLRSVEAIKHVVALRGGTGGGVPRPPRRILDEGDLALVSRQLAEAEAALAALEA